MSDATNPYAAPEFSDSPTEVDTPKVRQFDKELAAFAWPFVFLLNMIVPLLLGWDMTREQGRLGMFAASGMLLGIGWLLCVAKNSLARRLIVGGLLTALTQFVPILQLGAGLVSVWLADQLGLVIVGFTPQLRGEFGGFFVTLLVGGILIACAVVAGLIAGVVLPQRWMQSE